ncbi:PIN domain-containing protein [Bilifractor sp. LCP19S3_H10]|uniref:PIN domain-containing protein n=1 Tax=Bilifractor sp. LCP19S3_H10 TaxID=3438736 RepID=UPI003F9278E9
MKFTLAIIDTNIFVKSGCDFLGIKSKMLPALFETISEKGLTLLQSDIVDGEVKAHIRTSKLVEKFYRIDEAWKANEKLLEHYSIGKVSPVSKINLKEDLYQAYQASYYEAIHLEYPDPKRVFDSYFALKPPFSEKKKDEFPDGFVLHSVQDYLEEHSSDTLLVISGDNDWKNFFKGFSRVKACENIKEAQELLQNIDLILPHNFICKFIEANKRDLQKLAETEFEGQSYYINDYDSDDELDVAKVYSADIEADPELVIPLRVTRDKIVVQTLANCLIDGEGTIFDESRSVWDSEDHVWGYRQYSYLKFRKAIAETTCELEITYNFDELGDLSEFEDASDDELLSILANASQVENLSLTNMGDIKLDLDFDATEEIPLDDDDMANMVLREDKGYPAPTWDELKKSHKKVDSQKRNN